MFRRMMKGGCLIVDEAQSFNEREFLHCGVLEVLRL